MLSPGYKHNRTHADDDVVWQQCYTCPIAQAEPVDEKLKLLTDRHSHRAFAAIKTGATHRSQRIKREFQR